MSELKYDSKDLTRGMYEYWVTGRQSIFEHSLRWLEGLKPGFLSQTTIDKWKKEWLEAAVATLEADDANRDDWIFENSLQLDQMDDR